MIAMIISFMKRKIPRCIFSVPRTDITTDQGKKAIKNNVRNLPIVFIFILIFVQKEVAQLLEFFLMI